MTFDAVEGLEHLESNFERALYLQNILIVHATNGSSDDNHYQELRIFFLNELTTRNILPKWIRINRTLAQFWGFIQPKFATYAERRKFIYEEFAPLLEHLENLNKLPAEKAITERLLQFDEDGVHVAWQRALERKTNDPEGAITIARTMLESICKYILDDLNVSYDSKKTDLPKLYKITAKELNLSPEQHSEQIFKQILGGCAAIVDGLGSLRNKLGDAHGQGKNPVKPAPRHAELAVNLAGSMALFLVETYSSQKTIN